MGVSIRWRTWEGICFLGTLRDSCWRAPAMEHPSLCGSSVRGTWRGCSFTGDREGHVKEGSGNKHLS